MSRMNPSGNPVLILSGLTSKLDASVCVEKHPKYKMTSLDISSSKAEVTPDQTVPNHQDASKTALRGHARK